MTAIKKKLPPSSQSFHHFEKSTITKLDEIIECLDRIEKRCSAMETDMKGNDEALRIGQEVLGKQLYYYMEALMRENSKSSFDARFAMFGKLPLANGIIRLGQLATAKLMMELDRILMENKIEYWFGYGSLLGAITRNGPLPWDDDIDICMHREGFEKLMNILKSDKDFQVTIVYDWYVKCIQYRFCSKNVNIPAFIDIGIWDYGVKRTEERENRIQSLRAELMEELDKMKLPYWAKKGVMPKPGSGFMRQIGDNEFLDEWKNYDEKTVKKETDMIQAIFDKYVARAKEEGIFTDKNRAESYIYSFDNLTVGKRRMIYEKPMISPTVRVEYDGCTVSCPKDSKAFLDTCYSVWPYLPNDASILGNSHLNGETYLRPEIQEAVNQFIGKSTIK